MKNPLISSMPIETEPELSLNFVLTGDTSGGIRVPKLNCFSSLFTHDETPRITLAQLVAALPLMSTTDIQNLLSHENFLGDLYSALCFRILNPEYSDDNDDHFIDVLII